MYIVGHKAIETANGVRQPGEHIPEADEWPDPEPWVQTGVIVHVPDNLAPASAQAPERQPLERPQPERQAFEVRELLEMMTSGQLKDLCARRDVQAKGLSRPEIVDALLASRPPGSAEPSPAPPELPRDRGDLTVLVPMQPATGEESSGGGDVLVRSDGADGPR